MKKLSFFFLVFLSIFFTACSDDAIQCGCTDENSLNYDSLATTDDGTCISMVGCTGYSPEINRYGQVIHSFENAVYDQKFAEEVSLQREFFEGVPADIMLINEAGNMNAFASPDGYILFGYKVFWGLLQQFGELPIAGVLAHEWGHRTQFTFNWGGYYQPAHKELEADAFAGFYMFLAKRWAWSKVDSYYAAVSYFGDTNFNSPAHHGTSQERLAAARLGVEWAAYAVNNNYQFSYAELHNGFMEQITSVIKPRSNSNDEPVKYGEIEFPENVSKERAKALFPRK